MLCTCSYTTMTENEIDGAYGGDFSPTISPNLSPTSWSPSWSPDLSPDSSPRHVMTWDHIEDGEPKLACMSALPNGKSMTLPNPRKKPPPDTALSSSPATENGGAVYADTLPNPKKLIQNGAKDQLRKCKSLPAAIGRVSHSIGILISFDLEVIVPVP